MRSHLSVQVCYCQSQFNVHPPAPPPPSRQLQGLLDDIQASLLAQARAFRDDNIVDVSSYDELKEAVAAGAQTAPPPPLLLPPSQAPALATLAIPLLLDPL